MGDKRVALVTGAGRGIGRGVVGLFPAGSVTRLSAAILVSSVLGMVGCAGPGGVVETAVPPMVPVQVTVSVPTAPTEGPPQPQVSFEATTYRDDNAGFELDYPASWTPTYGEEGSRGAITQFAGDGTDLSIAVLLWDPRNDLDAYVANRKLAWDASGSTLVSEEEMTLAGDRRAVSFVVQSQTGEQAYYMFSTLGEQYLQLTGTGDLGLLAEIAGTVRPLDFN